MRTAFCPSFGIHKYKHIIALRRRSTGYTKKVQQNRTIWLGSLIRTLAIFIRCQDNGDLTQYFNQLQILYIYILVSLFDFPFTFCSVFIFINYLKSIDLKNMSQSARLTKISERHLRMINTIMIIYTCIYVYIRLSLFI